MRFALKDASSLDSTAIVDLWHAGWHEAHASIAPAHLTAVRSPEEFAARVSGILSDTRLAYLGDQLGGFCTVKGAELDQLYVAGIARGTGLAQALVADAERQIAETGAPRGVLKCGIGNDRAAAFYRKCGWVLAKTVTATLETSEGPYPLDVWQFEKAMPT